jgi:hypothetical protein
VEHHIHIPRVGRVYWTHLYKQLKSYQKHPILD